MCALLDLQRAFLGAVLAGDASAMGGLVREDGIPASQRLQIYRNNARATFLATLRATYPVIERLGGADWFAQTGERYRAKHPSHCGDLQYAGAHFPGFLEDELAGTDYGYFGDVARLEWARQEVLTAADAPPLPLARLAAVPPGDYGRLVFSLHPALRTVASTTPILAIWRTNQPGSPDEGQPVDLSSGPCRVLLTRQSDHLELRECPAGLFALLRALAGGRTLDAAAKLALRVDRSLDLAAGLQRLAGLGAFTGFRLGTTTGAIPEEP